jgi:large exoprotein involved in heme utilization and adhesion
VLELLNGAQLQANTSGNGNAGNFAITAREQVTLQGTNPDGFASAIFSDSDFLSNGQGGDIRIAAPTLQVQAAAVLEASTRNAQPGGDIMLSLGRLEVRQGGQITTNSFSSGTAGTIQIDATDGILIGGSDPTFAERVLRVPNLGEEFRPESNLSAQSSDTGAAGNIVIGTAGTTPSLVMEDGGLMIAESAAVDGGNITLNLTELLLLREGSLISASAGTAQAGGDGGNIEITAPFIIAVSTENSDIAADAFAGNGGNVDITARGVFGIEPRSQRTPLSDITASSTLGISGAVNFEVLDTGFIEGSLTDLSSDLIGPDALTAGSCIARSPQATGSFVVTGPPGLPARPGNGAIPAFATGTVQPLPSTSPTAIQEPAAVYQLADGRLVLSHPCR